MTGKQPIHTLTGLRFLAALAVFIHHLAGKFGYAVNPYSIGSIAVSFFFVLSGFVLTYAYHDRLNRWSDVAKFYFNRFARIWPLHVVCLILSVTTSQGFARFQEPDIWGKLAANIFLLQSWFTDNQWVFSFNGVSWSVSAEAFFYLIFPLLLFANGKRIKTTMVAMFAIVLVAAAAVAYLENQGQYPAIDFFRIGHVNPLMRLPDFLIGAIAGRIFLNRQQGQLRPHQFWVDTIQELFCVALLIGTCIWISDLKLQQQIAKLTWGGSFLASWFRVEYPLLLFGCAVYVFAKSKGLFSKLLGNRLFVYLGDVSYAFYMVHAIVLRNIFFGHNSYGVLAGWQLAILSFLVALGSSIVLYELVEMPMKRLLHAWYSSRSSVNQINSQAKRRFVVLKCLFGIAAIAIPLTFLANNVVQYERSDVVKRVIHNSDEQIRDINFGSHIKLLGLETRLTPKKLEIRFAWFKKIEFNARRLVTVIDDKGKMIGRGQHNQAAIKESVPGESFDDRVFVALDAIKPGSEVIVSFRLSDNSNLPVDRGRIRQRNQALLLLTYDELQNLIDQSKNK